MNYLITGGAGFLGLHLANQLFRRGNSVVSIDIADHDPAEYPKGILCHKADIRHPDWGRFLKGVDVVIHAAAALPGRSPREIESVNVLGTQNVLENCLKNRIERVVSISSSGVYGLPEKNPMEEDDPLVGIGVYAQTKIKAEELCREYRKKGLCIPILRAKTIVGTGRLGAFQILFDWMESGKRIPIIGSGKNLYQLVHVEDVINAIQLASTAPADRINSEFNVGAKKFGTVAEDVGALCRFAASGSKILPTPAWPIKKILRLFEILKLSPLYQWFYESADKNSFVSTKRLEKLGWHAEKSNTEMLTEAYQWYLGNRGTMYRTPWKQGILKVAKAFL